MIHGSQRLLNDPAFKGRSDSQLYWIDQEPPIYLNEISAQPSESYQYSMRTDENLFVMHHQECQEAKGQLVEAREEFARMCAEWAKAQPMPILEAVDGSDMKIEVMDSPADGIDDIDMLGNPAQHAPIVLPAFELRPSPLKQSEPSAVYESDDDVMFVSITDPPEREVLVIDDSSATEDAESGDDSDASTEVSTSKIGVCRIDEYDDDVLIISSRDALQSVDPSPSSSILVSAADGDAVQVAELSPLIASAPAGDVLQEAAPSILSPSLIPAPAGGSVAADMVFGHVPATITLYGPTALSAYYGPDAESVVGPGGYVANRRKFTCAKCNLLQPCCGPNICISCRHCTHVPQVYVPHVRSDLQRSRVRQRFTCSHCSYNQIKVGIDMCIKCNLLSDYSVRHSANSAATAPSISDARICVMRAQPMDDIDLMLDDAFGGYAYDGFAAKDFNASYALTDLAQRLCPSQ